MPVTVVLFLLVTQECFRDSRGKRAIGVRATEVLLYFVYDRLQFWKGYIIHGKKNPQQLRGLTFSGGGK